MTLGTNWSGLPKVKQEHELIVKGPYALVRHPIYSGLLLGLAGTFIAVGTLGGVLVWVLMAISYAIKMRQEERLMRETFPEGIEDERQGQAKAIAVHPGFKELTSLEDGG